MCVEGIREAEKFCVLFPVYLMAGVHRALGRCTIPFRRNIEAPRG